MKQAIVSIFILNALALSQTAAVAQWFGGSRANATGSLRAVLLDDGTITRFQLMRLNYLGAGQSRKAMRLWASWRMPNQVALVRRYPAFVSSTIEVYRVADGSSSGVNNCVQLTYTPEGSYTGNYTFVRCPE